jgi:hypothetical protein
MPPVTNLSPAGNADSSSMHDLARSVLRASPLRRAIIERSFSAWFFIRPLGLAPKGRRRQPRLEYAIASDTRPGSALPCAGSYCEKLANPVKRLFQTWYPGSAPKR